MKKLRYIFLVLGGGIFAYLIYHLGLENILGQLKALGWRFLPIFGLTLIWYSLYTLAWLEFLKRSSQKIHFTDLFRIKISGEAMNTVTPANFIGGDPVRILLLRKRIPVTEGAASVVVDRTLHIIATLIIILIGGSLALIKIPTLPLNIRYGLPVVMIAASIFVAFVLIHQHKGLSSFFIDFLKRFRLKKTFSPSTLEKLEELDRNIADFYQTNRQGFWTALSYHVIGRFLGIVEIYAIGYCVDPNFSFLAALILGAAAPVIIFTFSFIPGALGVMEGTYGGILYLLGLDPTIGLAIQIVRRARAAIWIGIGLAILGFKLKPKSNVGLNEVRN